MWNYIVVRVPQLCENTKKSPTELCTLEAYNLWHVSYISIKQIFKKNSVVCTNHSFFVFFSQLLDIWFDSGGGLSAKCCNKHPLPCLHVHMCDLSGRYLEVKSVFYDVHAFHPIRRCKLITKVVSLIIFLPRCIHFQVLHILANS